MAKITKSLSALTDAEGCSRILLRVTVSRTLRMRVKTNIFVPRNRWNAERGEIVLPRMGGVERGELLRKREELAALETKANRVCENATEPLTSEYMAEVLPLLADVPPAEVTPALIADKLEEARNPEMYADGRPKTFFGVYDEYLKRTAAKCSKSRNGMVLWGGRVLRRYELFQQFGGGEKDFKIIFDKLDKNTLADIMDYVRAEADLAAEYPRVFERMRAAVGYRFPKRESKRGNNTMAALQNVFRAFFRWAVAEGYTDKNPFLGYKGLLSEKYGTPYYLSIEERNAIADFDLSATPALAVQRDIFIFQCLIGCRVSDLLRLSSKNIIDGAVEYVPQKTATERPRTVRVPLNARARALVERYRGADSGGRLFPFSSAEAYNRAIKEVFSACGITRAVTVINPKTGKEEQRPINEVASSHMARRTFVGNLYKQVKDPNLVGVLSGHVEGSTAFARYRTIDEDMKKELVNLID